MIKAIGLGLALPIIGVVSGYVLKKWDLTMEWLGIVSLIFLFIASIESRSGVGGSQIRVEYTLQSQEERRNNLKWALRFFVVGFPGLVTTLVYFGTKSGQ